MFFDREFCIESVPTLGTNRATPKFREFVFILAFAILFFPNLDFVCTSNGEQVMFADVAVLQIPHIAVLVTILYNRQGGRSERDTSLLHLRTSHPH